MFSPLTMQSASKHFYCLSLCTSVAMHICRHPSTPKSNGKNLRSYSGSGSVARGTDSVVCMMLVGVYYTVCSCCVHLPDCSSVCVNSLMLLNPAVPPRCFRNPSNALVSGTTQDATIMLSCLSHCCAENDPNNMSVVVLWWCLPTGRWSRWAAVSNKAPPDDQRV